VRLTAPRAHTALAHAVRRAVCGRDRYGGCSTALALAALAAGAHFGRASAAAVFPLLRRQLLVDVRFRGKPLYSASFTFAAHDSTADSVHAAHPLYQAVSADTAVTAGDLYDSPDHFKVSVYARRADGAIAFLARDAEGDRDSELYDDEDVEEHAQSFHAVRFTASVGKEGSDGLGIVLKLWFEPRDSNAPMSFLVPDFHTRRTNKPRPPECWHRSGDYSIGNLGEWHGDAPIPEAELANRVLICFDEEGECAVLRFDEEGDDCSCEQLCSALGVLRWEAA